MMKEKRVITAQNPQRVNNCSVLVLFNMIENHTETSTLRMLDSVRISHLEGYFGCIPHVLPLIRLLFLQPCFLLSGKMKWQFVDSGKRLQFISFL